MENQSAKAAQAKEAPAPKTAEAKPEEVKVSRKKLEKSIEGTVVTIKEGITGKTMTYDFSKLPKEIQAKLGPFGLGHKLGDAAAGKQGQEAVDAINKVFEGLMANDWSVRAPAGERVSKAEINARVQNLDPKEREKATALLASLGIDLSTLNQPKK